MIVLIDRVLNQHTKKEGLSWEGEPNTFKQNQKCCKLISARIKHWMVEFRQDVSSSSMVPYYFKLCWTMACQRDVCQSRVDYYST